ncbi:MAG TPA: hypothetical protein VFI62_00945 [Burkholderiales bacterium]|nr:hypothetical protein [Burkholderiales bacterium]
MSSTTVEPKFDSDRYRALFYRHLTRQAAIQAIADSGGRTAFLLPLIEPHLTVREDGDRFTVLIVDKDTGLEQPQVSIADVLAEMRCSEEPSGAFDAKINPGSNLINNPFAVGTENFTQQAGGDRG